MLELGIGFLLGIFSICIFRSGVISGYIEEVSRLEEENRKLKEKLYRCNNDNIL